jgi:hypothetical protein
MDISLLLFDGRKGPTVNGRCVLLPLFVAFESISLVLLLLLLLLLSLVLVAFGFKEARNESLLSMLLFTLMPEASRRNGFLTKTLGDFPFTLFLLLLVLLL